MANVKSKEYPIIEIKNLPNKNIVFQNLRDINTKNNVKTSTYYFKLENESTSKENQDVAFVSIDEALDGETIQDPSGAEYVALEVQDSGQIILHDKDVVLWGELCRICANPCDQFVPIFSGEGLENSLSNKIHAYLPLRVSENDDLPHQLCYNCAATLVAYDDIYRGCLDAQKRLNDLHDKLVPKDPIATETAEDENFETILEVDKNKDENEIEEVEDNNLTETQRPNSTKTSQNQSNIKKNSRENENFHSVVCTLMKLAAEPKSSKEKPPPSTLKSDDLHDNVNKNKKLTAPTKKLSKTNEKTKSNIGTTIEKGSLCPTCGKLLSSRVSLIQHLQVHSDERSFICDSCGKQFRSYSGLYRHQQEVHNKVQKFSCNVCKKKFGCKATRDNHIRTHTGERPYPCRNCEASFKSSAALYMHEKIHKNEFPYECFDCDKKFRRRQEMVHHVSIHTGEMKFECKLCQKKFRVKAELNRHGLVHSDAKPFQCNLCLSFFKQRRYLNKHCKKMHNKKRSGNLTSKDFKQKTRNLKRKLLELKFCSRSARYSRRTVQNIHTC